MKGMQFLKKNMIPLHWSHSMTKVSHSLRHNPIPMDPSHYDNFSLTDHLGELVLSPTSYTSKFCSSHPNEV